MSLFMYRVGITEYTGVWGKTAVIIYSINFSVGLGHTQCL
jgi:hypothetical protein